VSRVSTRAVVSLVALTTLAGCAGQTTLEIGYPEASANRALLASARPRRVVVDAVTDRRTDKSRLGPAPKDGTPIVTSRPVPDIIRDALVVELRKNGHEVVAGPGDVVVAADVEEFSLAAVGRSGDTQYLGRVAIAVAIADGRTGDRLLTRRYVGITRRTAGADSKETWREVMDTALVRAIHDFATDPDLASTVGRIPPTSRPAGTLEPIASEDAQPAPAIASVRVTTSAAGPDGSSQGRSPK
jgi:uncharacterized lipoprotein YajG